MLQTNLTIKILLCYGGSCESVLLAEALNIKQVKYED